VKNRPPGDVGGKFYTWNVQNLTTKASNTRWGDSPANVPWIISETSYDLPLYACNPEAQVTPPDMQSSILELDAKGTTAIARCKPTNSVADLSVFLGELVKDRLPSLPFLRSLEQRVQLAYKAGDEFLNVVFGWEPLVADIKKSARALKHAQTVIQQFERDAGKQVRRRYNFNTEHSIDTVQVSSGVGPWYGPVTNGTADNALGHGPLFRTREITRDIWFSGAFTYHIPQGYLGSGDIVAKADKLLGLELTPSVLWELAPWSWAIDWVTNIGDGLSNLSDWSQFGLVLRYGYIMETVSVKDTYTLLLDGPLGRTLEVEPVVIRKTVKQRRPANPFGFGVTWDGLNPLQLAIAGALGITRV